MRATVFISSAALVALGQCLALPAGPAKLPATCSNEGLQWAAYSITQALDDNSSFDPTYIQTQDIELGPGVANQVGTYRTKKNSNSMIFGSTQKINTELMTLDIVGYFYAPKTGPYTFSSPYADDLLYIWVGTQAYAGWTASNANMYISDSQPKSFSVDMIAGQYWPVRIILANRVGDGGYTLQITAPDGSNALRPGQLVQYSCDGTTAPPFPDYASTDGPPGLPPVYTVPPRR